MPSDFATAWAGAAPAIDVRFGELFQYRPMKINPSGGRAIPDPARQTMQITGAYTQTPVFAFPQTRGRRGSIVSQEATEELTIDIAKGALPYSAATGDLLTRLETGEIFEVNGPAPDGIARVELRVVKLKGAS